MTRGTPIALLAVAAALLGSCAVREGQDGADARVEAWDATWERDRALDGRAAELVARLGAERVEDREEAQRGLAELGPEVITYLRARPESAGDDERRARLSAVLEELWRQDERIATVGRPVLVSARVRRAPVERVVQEIGRVTRLSFDVRVAGGAVVEALEFARLPWWRALDRVCEARAGLHWTCEGERVVVTDRGSRPAWGDFFDYYGSFF